jgi:hypothetical protein
LSNRAQDLNHHWLENQEDLNVNEIKCRVDESKSSIKIEQASESLKDVDDKFILNSKQFRLFDRVLNHYLSSSEKQLFIHVNDEIETSKSLCIDMISKHLHYHARQRFECCSIIRAAFTDVATHNIQSITLHQLLALFVQTQFNELDSNRLARLQRIFRHCKLLIIDEKSMIELRFLYKIDYRLRVICV